MEIIETGEKHETQREFVEIVVFVMQLLIVMIYFRRVGALDWRPSVRLDAGPFPSALNPLLHSFGCMDIESVLGFFIPPDFRR